MLAMTQKHKRHWSFIVTDTRYLFPLVSLLLLFGLYDAVVHSEPERFNRVGNFVIAIGVWMSMRSTLREGIKKEKNLSDQSPVVPGTRALNANYFNNITFSIGDANLQIQGFCLVILGSVIGSYGDYILEIFY